jgi:hypothetical protein
MIIEKAEPVATVITSDRILENALYSADKTKKKVYSNLNPVMVNK